MPRRKTIYYKSIVDVIRIIKEMLSASNLTFTCGRRIECKTANKIIIIKILALPLLFYL
jgi:hypothetical protein